MDVKICEKQSCESEEIASFTAVLDHRGRITVPSSVRKRLRVGFKSEVEVTTSRRKIE